MKRNWENSTGEAKPIVLTLIFTLFYCYSFLPEVQRFLLLYFLSVQRTFFSHSFVAGLLATNSLGLLSSENFLISPSFLKDIFTGYRILIWQFFSFSTWKRWYHSLLTSMGSERIMLSLKSKTSFLSHCFQDLFNVFSFQKFDYDVPWHGFLWIHPLWNILSFLNLSFMSFAKFGKFSTIISLYIFFSTAFFILF